MFIKYLTIIFFALILNSCISIHCFVDDDTPCGTKYEQATRFIEKLIEHPCSWECIMENEKCIDCSAFLEKTRTYKNSYYSTRQTVLNISQLNCEVTGYHIGIHPKMETVPEIKEDTKVFVIEMNKCKQPKYDPKDTGGIISYDVEFKIKNDGSLELFWFWNTGAY